MARPLLIEVVKRELRERGYVEAEPNPAGGGVWRSPEGATDHILPMIEDCFEREAEAMGNG